jgi:hypothetical protein
LENAEQLPHHLASAAEELDLGKFVERRRLVRSDGGWARRRPLIVIFEEGLLLGHESRTDYLAVLWEEVTEYFIGALKKSVNFSHRYTSYVHDLRLSGGQNVVITGASTPSQTSAVETLDQTIGPFISLAQRRKIVEQQASGAPIAFRNLEVTSAGLRLTTRKRRKPNVSLLHWGDIESIRASDGDLHIREIGSRHPWVSTPVATFPNLYTFLDLVLPRLETWVPRS